MKRRFFTFLMAFLATLSGAVWAQEPTYTEINQSNLNNFTDASGKEIYLGDRYSAGEYYYTLNNVTYEVDASACQVRPNCIVHLKLEGTNTLQSGHNFPGIFVPTSSTLIIEGDGTLNASCYASGQTDYANGAGIGGSGEGSGMTADFGTIIIKSGTVNASCRANGMNAHANAAGIGGGEGSEHGTIIIMGGTVTAGCYDPNGVLGNSAAAGAAIGGGYNGTCDNITILGGNITVTNDGNTKGMNIGKGSGSDSKSAPSIIFGKWDINADKPEIVCQQNTIDKTNFLDAKDGTPTEAKGTVTMPEGTQMYLASEPTASGFTLNAYFVNFHSSKLQADGEHNVNNFPDDKVNLYCGANHSIEVSNALTCTQNHNFMGWLKGTAIEQGSEIIASKGENDTYSYNTGVNTPADYKNNKTVFTSVWVDNEYPISVKSGTEWTASGDLNQIFTTPDAAKTLLTYKLPSLDSYPELNGTNATSKALQMSSNYLIGTPTLSSGVTYKQIELPVEVYVTTEGDTYKKTTNVKINIFDKKLVFTKVEKSDISHTYNGSVHNDIGANENHLLKVTAQTEDGGSGSVEITDVKEEAHYRIYSYTYKSFVEGAVEENKTADNLGANKSLEIKNAGTYSDIVLEPLGENEFSSTGEGFSVESDGKAKLTNVTIEVAQKEVTVKPNANQECKVGGTLELSTLEYDPAAGTSTGIGEEKYNYSGTLSLGDSYSDTNSKGAYTIQQGSLAFADGTSGNVFKAANYKMEFSDEVVKFLVLEDISSNSNISVEATELTYNGSAQTPTITVKQGETAMTSSDYKISITGADSDGKVTNAGDYTVTVTGSKEAPGYFTGSKTATLKVNPITLTSVKANDQTIQKGQQPQLDPTIDATVITLEGVLSEQTPKFSAGELEVVDETTLKIKEEPALALADNSEGNFLAQNYKLPEYRTFGTGTLTIEPNEDIEIEVPDVPEGVQPDADGNYTFPYDGKSHAISAENVKVKGTPLTDGECTITYTKDGNEFTNQEGKAWDKGLYVATVEITQEGTYKGYKVPVEIEITARTLSVTILDQTIEAGGSITTTINAQTVQATTGINGETAIINGSLSNTQQDIKAGTIYEGVITATNFTLADGGEGNNFKATNYSLPESIAAADLTVKQSIDGGDGTDPIDPTDPDDEGNPIILPDGWTWDATSKGFRVTYDGNDHEVSALKVKFTDSESGESIYKELASEYIEEVTYSPSKPHDAGDYTASIEIKENDLIKAGTYTIKLQVVKREMYVDFILPSTIESTAPLAITNSRVKYEAQSGIRGLLTKEQYPVIESGQFIFGKPNAEGQCTVTIHNFILATSTSGFKPGNYQLQVWDAEVGDYVDYNNEGGDITIIDPDYPGENPNNPGGGDSGVVVDPDGSDDDDDNDHGHGGSDINRPAKYYNMYVDSAATCDGVELWFDKNVVRAGNQASVYVKIEEGYDAEHMKLWFKRSLYGYWEELEEGVQPGEYIIYNVYTDIYVKATDVEKDPTGIEEIEGVKVYAQNGSIYVYTPNRLPVWIVSMTGAVVRNEEQVGLQQYDRLNQGIYIVRVGEQVFKIRL